MQHHIFLSYSRRDLAMMQRLRNDLRGKGLLVWTDEGIHPGTISWKESIERAIRESGILMVLLSPDANESKWVQREIDYAEVRGIPILPVLIKGEPRDAIPFALAGSQFVDVRADYDTGLKLLLQRSFHLLPPDYIKTIPSRRADTTQLSDRSLRNQRMKGWLAAGSALGIFMLFLAAFLFAQRITAQLDNQVVAESSPTMIPSEETFGNTLLRYNTNTLVLINRNSEQVSLLGVSFDLLETNRRLSFPASDWSSQILTTGRCVQIWGMNFSYLPPNEHPAEDCESRLAYRSSRQTFWRSTVADAEFSISRYGQEIQRCPAIAFSSEETLSCIVDL